MTNPTPPAGNEERPLLPSPEPAAQLIAEIRQECTGADCWYAMNEDEDGYSMSWDNEREAERWFAQNPLASRGYHLVKRRHFDPSETLALRAADLLADRRAALSQSQAEAEQPAEVLCLLKMPPSLTPVYFVLRRPTYEQNDNDRMYFFEEHSCPVNWINETVMIAKDGDTDPHGFLEFVRSTPASAELDAPDKEDASIVALFPELEASPGEQPAAQERAEPYRGGMTLRECMEAEESQAEAPPVVTPPVHQVLANAALMFGEIHRLLEKRMYDEAMLHAGAMEVQMQKALAAQAVVTPSLSDAEALALYHQVQTELEASPFDDWDAMSIAWVRAILATRSKP